MNHDDDEFPNLSNRWTLAIALAAVGFAAMVSAYFPMGVAWQ